MERNYLLKYKNSDIPSPAYIIDTDAIERNLEIIDRIQTESRAKVLLALKGFATVATFPILKKVLKGVCTSSLHEAKLGRECFGNEIHTYSPAYKGNEIDEINTISNSIIFNSINQWEKYKHIYKPNKKYGIRINPEHSETNVDIYNPCSAESRLGMKANQLDQLDLGKLSGAHMHSLCQNGADSLERTLEIVEKNFSKLLNHISWFNAGGGHFLTHPDYDIEKLVTILNRFQKKYDLQVYLEPGEAIVWKTGILMSTVLDIIPGEVNNAILDTSVTCHMPDVLEMPYRPEIENAADKNVYPYNYNLGGVSCLAGDTLGCYSFQKPLKIGQTIELNDMSQYTMVKSTTFNGIQLPSVVLVSTKNNTQEIVQKFSYTDFKSRLV